MANGLKILLRIIVVLLIILAIAGAVLYFTSLSQEQKQVYQSYTELKNTDEFNRINEKMQYSDTNKFISYGNSVVGHSDEFKAIAKCYDASITIFDDLCENLYFVSNSESNERKNINEKLDRIKTTSAQAVAYAQIFENELNQFSVPRTDAEEAELLKTFNIFKAKFLEHTNLISQTNNAIYDFVVAHSLNGGSELSLKYQLMGLLVRQCNAISNTSNDMTLYANYFADLDKILKKYKSEKTTDFINGSVQTQKAYGFLNAYSKIEQTLKDNFINSSNKTDFYKTTLVSAEKQMFNAVYEYFGIAKGA